MRINPFTTPKPVRSGQAPSKSQAAKTGSATDSFTRGASETYRATCRAVGALGVALMFKPGPTKGQFAEEAASESSEESTSSTSEEESTTTSEAEEENVSSTSSGSRGASSSTAWGAAVADEDASVDGVYFLPYVAGQTYTPNSTYVPPVRGITVANGNITALPAGVVGMPVAELAQRDIEVQPVGKFTDPTDVHDFYDPSKGQTNPAVNCTMGTVNGNNVVVGGVADLINTPAFQQVLKNQTNSTGNLTQVHVDLLAGMLNLTALPAQMLNVTALRTSCMAPPPPPPFQLSLAQKLGIGLGVGLGVGVALPGIICAACCIAACRDVSKSEHQAQKQRTENRIHSRHGTPHQVIASA